MSTHPRRAVGSAAVAVLLAAVPLVAACDVGQNAVTKTERFTHGSNYSFGPIRLQSVEVHPPTGTDSITGAASLTFSVFNQGQTPVQLTSVSTDIGGQVQSGAPPSAGPSALPSASVSASASASASGTASGTASASGSASPSASPSTSAPVASGLPLSVPPGGGLAVGPGGQAQLLISGIDQSLRLGEVMFLEFQFTPGGSSGRIAVPITPAEGTTATVTPNPAASTSYAPEPIDPSYYSTPYDDRTGASPGGSGR